MLQKCIFKYFIICFCIRNDEIRKAFIIFFQFVNKFNVMYDRQGMGRRMRGLFFWEQGTSQTCAEEPVE